MSMKPILENSGSDIDRANAATADLGIACERCSQALLRIDREGTGPLSSAAVTGSSPAEMVGEAEGVPAPDWSARLWWTSQASYLPARGAFAW